MEIERMKGNKLSKNQVKRRRVLYRRTPKRWGCRIYKTRSQRRAWADARDACEEMG